MCRYLGVLILLFCVGCGGGPGAGQKSASEQPDPNLEASKYAKDPVLLRQKAEEFWQKGQYKEAAAFLEPIVKMAPDLAEGQYSLAFSEALSGNDQQAVEHYTKALQLGYSEFWVKYNRGAAYLALGDKEKAREDLLRAQQLDPKSEGVNTYLKQLEK
jgi:tetratricopeptide (TPR) repeat protein